MRTLFKKLAVFSENLQEVWKSIDNSDAVRKYGAAARKVERAKAIESWRDASLRAIEAFENDEWPKRQAARKEATAKALNYISNGGPVQRKDRSGFANREILEALDSVEGAVQSLARQQAVSAAFALAERQDTRSIQSKLETYRADAASGDAFDYRTWAVDRLVLPAILAARAAAGDDRAGMAAGAPAEIEESLIGRWAPSDDASMRDDLLDIESRIRAVDGDGGKLADAQARLAFIGRGLERQAAFEQANPQRIQPPKPKGPATLQAVAMAPAPAQRPASAPTQAA